MKRIIQFLHPGKEHNATASYISKKSKNSQRDNLYFWGEWEAPSKVLKNVNSANKNFPKNIFSPYYTPESGTVNTDPFVFGKEFYYFICKQGHYPSLRNIPDGSIILFGSNKNNIFVLDTLFVVKSCDEYDIREIETLKYKYNTTFFNVSLKPVANKLEYVDKKEIKKDSCGSCLPSNNDDEDDYKPTKNLHNYKIYRAVMYHEKENFDGMYSFVPCMAGSRGENGFERPRIVLPDVISNEQNQGIKNFKTDNIKPFWENIKEQIFNNHQNLDLLVECYYPPLHKE